jgi:hypothetical protein
VSAPDRPLVAEGNVALWKRALRDPDAADELAMRYVEKEGTWRGEPAVSRIRKAFLRGLSDGLAGETANPWERGNYGATQRRAWQAAFSLAREIVRSGWGMAQGVEVGK